MAVIELYGTGTFGIGITGASGLDGIQNPGKRQVVSARPDKITAYGIQNYGRGNEKVLVEYDGYFRVKGRGSKARLKGGTLYGFEAFTTGLEFSGFTVTGIRIDANEFRYGDASAIEQYYLSGDDIVTGSIRDSQTTAFLQGGNDAYTGYSGINTVNLGAGDDTYTSIGGFAYVEGGIGSDTFKPHIGDGFMWVKDYQPGIDTFIGFSSMTGFATVDPDGQPALGVGISSDSVLAVFTGLSSIAQL